MTGAVLLLVAALGGLADAGASAGPNVAAPPSFAVLPFELPEPFRDRRDALVTIVAARLERGGGRVITRADALTALVQADQVARAGSTQGGVGAEHGQVSLTAGGSPDIAKLKLEYGYPLLPEVWIVAQGSAFVSRGQLSAVPAGFGLKYVFGPEHRIRPFAGVLVGIALADREASFHLIGTGGIWFVLWKGAGFVIEASADSSTVQQSPEGHTIFSGTSTAGFSYTW